MRRYILAIAMLVALVALASCAAAGKESGTEVLGFGDYIGVRIQDDVSSMDISYDVKVTWGSDVNVYFMEGTDYTDLQSGDDFAYYVSFSVENTRDVKKDWTWTDEGTYYVVIYNMATPIDNSTVTYTVKWEKTPAANRAFDFICGVLALIGILLAVGFIRSYLRKKVAAARAPSQPLPPPFPGQYPMAGQYPQPGYYPPPGQYPPPEQYPPPPQGGAPPPTG